MKKTLNNYWKEKLNSWKKWDKLITGFNEKTGLLKKYQK